MHMHTLECTHTLTSHNHSNNTQHYNEYYGQYFQKRYYVVSPSHHFHTPNQDGSLESCTEEHM